MYFLKIFILWKKNKAKMEQSQAFFYQLNLSNVCVCVYI